MSTSDTLQQAQRAWLRAGVRRRDRAALSRELTAEIEAARADSATTDVLGDDVATTAREWAQARGLTDRRLRLGAFVLPSLVAGAVAGGAVLAELADAFTQNGATATTGLDGQALLAVYVLGAVLSTLAIAGTAGVVLHLLGDGAAALTAKIVALALPIGALVATVAAVLAADAMNFDVVPRTFVVVAVIVVGVLALTLAVARVIAVHRHVRRQGVRGPDEVLEPVLP